MNRRDALQAMGVLSVAPLSARVGVASAPTSTKPCPADDDWEVPATPCRVCPNAFTRHGELAWPDRQIHCPSSTSRHYGNVCPLWLKSTKKRLERFTETRVALLFAADELSFYRDTKEHPHEVYRGLMAKARASL